jgi:hypothetical protein
MGGTPKPPKPLPPVRMPAQGDEAAKQAKKRAQQQLLGSRGREATDLAPDTDSGSLDSLGR